MKKKKIAVGDKLIVKYDSSKKETTKGGIILTDTSKDLPNEGEVISIGSEVKNIKVGDNILFSPYEYDEIENDFFIMSEYSVWAKIEKETKTK
jgi:chaperonin GroES